MRISALGLQYTAAGVLYCGRRMRNPEILRVLCGVGGVMSRCGRAALVVLLRNEMK